MEVKNNKIRVTGVVTAILVLILAVFSIAGISGKIAKFNEDVTDSVSVGIVANSVESPKADIKQSNKVGAKYVQKDAIETGIEINTSDMKTDYLINEQVDLSGIKVLVIYDDNTTKEISNKEYTISDVDMSIYGTKELEVSYKNFSKTFDIEVIFKVDECDTKTMYSKASLNIRKGPATTFESVGKLSLNDKVSVTGLCDNGWSRIKYKDEDLYVSTTYLSDSLIIEDCEPKTMYATTTVNVRSGPGTGYDIVGKLSLNNDIKVTGKCGDWSRVEYKDTIAFMSSKYLSSKKIEYTASNSGGKSGNYMDTAAVAAQMASRPGMIGRLFIPSIGLNVALFNSYSQGTVDARDSAGTYRYGGGQMMIADHKNQGFSAIKSASPGAIAYINNGRTVQAYRCTVKGVGSNSSNGVPYDLLDCNGNSLYLQNSGGIGMYTCNSHWTSITYTMWAPN